MEKFEAPLRNVSCLCLMLGGRAMARTAARGSHGLRPHPRPPKMPLNPDLWLHGIQDTYATHWSFVLSEGEVVGGKARLLAG